MTEPLAPDVTIAEFRMAMGRFATGVTVVTTTVDGVDLAMTASSLTSVSLEPLLMLVCVEREARFHDAVLSTGWFGVSILGSEQRATAQWLATRGRPLHDQLDRVPHVRGPRTGAPLLTGALARLECRTTTTYPAGDHTIVLAAVESVDVETRPESALTYYRSRYGSLS